MEGVHPQECHVNRLSRVEALLAAPCYSLLAMTHKLVIDIENAIIREKQIKAGSRQRKVQLINQMNREWRDLHEEL